MALWTNFYLFLALFIKKMIIYASISFGSHFVYISSQKDDYVDTVLKTNDSGSGKPVSQR